MWIIYRRPIHNPIPNETTTLNHTHTHTIPLRRAYACTVVTRVYTIQLLLWIAMILVWSSILFFKLWKIWCHFCLEILFHKSVFTNALEFFQVFLFSTKVLHGSIHMPLSCSNEWNSGHYTPPRPHAPQSSFVELLFCAWAVHVLNRGVHVLMFCAKQQVQHVLQEPSGIWPHHHREVKSS